MASKNIVAKGTTYNGVESVTFPVSGGGNATFYEISDTTAVAADVDSSKWFYTALGVLTQGTASGGGGGSTGLVYETGTWTPSADISSYTISFSNAHTDAPIFAMICDSDTSSRTANSNVFTIIGNLYGFLGFYLEQGSQTRYGVAIWHSTNSSGGFATSNANLSTAEALGNWMSSSGFQAYTNSASRYWRANRTYKWIAIWAPTT